MPARRGRRARPPPAARGCAGPGTIACSSTSRRPASASSARSESRVNQRRWLASNVPLSCCGQRPRISVSRACQCATFGTLTSTAPPGRHQLDRPREPGRRVGEVLEDVGEHDEVERAGLERQLGILDRALHDLVADLAPRRAQRSRRARGRRGGRPGRAAPRADRPRRSRGRAPARRAAAGAGRAPRSRRCRRRRTSAPWPRRAGRARDRWMTRCERSRRGDRAG